MTYNKYKIDIDYTYQEISSAVRIITARNEDEAKDEAWQTVQEAEWHKNPEYEGCCIEVLEKDVTPRCKKTLDMFK